MAPSQKDLGATSVEYALMAGLVAAVIALAVGAFGQAVIALFTPIISAF